MESFSVNITIQAGFRPKFFFNTIYKVNGSCYHVSVKDTERNLWFFNMEARNGEWKIINAPKVPDWIINVEMRLVRAIYRNMFRKEKCGKLMMVFSTDFKPFPCSGA
jgi:hypothetical protein